MIWTADLLQAIFFALSGVAVLVGGSVALWRFVLQRPFGVSWKVEPAADCRVRLMSDGRYWYMLRFDVHNLSVARQECTRVWTKVIFPDESGSTDPQPSSITAEQATERFGKAAELHRVVPVGGYVGVMPGAALDKVVDLVIGEIAIETESRRLLGLLPGRDVKMYFGGMIFPVNVEDIRLYRDAP